MDFLLAIGTVEIVGSVVLLLLAGYLFLSTVWILVSSFGRQAVFNWYETISSFVFSVLLGAMGAGLYFTGKTLPQGNSWADLSTGIFLVIALLVVIELAQTGSQKKGKKRKK